VIILERADFPAMIAVLSALLNGFDKCVLPLIHSLDKASDVIEGPLDPIIDFFIGHILPREPSSLTQGSFV
jgi:hypothetical protein